MKLQELHCIWMKETKDLDITNKNISKDIKFLIN